ncbi:MAG: UPF0158 family protein [bacterium]|nr:UPF0158 family protein [bacterium]
MRKLCVELADLIEAFESEAEGIFYYLDRLNGEVIKVSEDYCADETISQIDYNDPERFVKIDPLPPEEVLKIRENFLKSVEDEGIRDRLEEALMHRGPIRKFAEIIEQYDECCQKWKQFQRQIIKSYAQKWAGSLDLAVEFI